MNYARIIEALAAERDRIARTIAQLEELALATDGSGELPRPAGRRRGRKGMTAAERAEVSERMRRYWANRRRQQRARIIENGEGY